MQCDRRSNHLEATGYPSEEGDSALQTLRERGFGELAGAITIFQCDRCYACPASKT